MEFGLAESEAVGAGGGGGGGGGGGACFFLQAPNIMMAPRMNTKVSHFICGRFTFSSLQNRCLNQAYGLKPVPSANITTANRE